jgi:transcriptional regulator with XRE-family HTH domain
MTHETKLLVCNIGYRLKEERLRRRLRLEEVAFGVEINKSVIKRLEAGTSNFTVDTIVPLIEFYGLSYSSLFMHYTTLPTLSQWRHLELLQKEQNRYYKSKQKLKPQTGVQLMLKF